MSRKEKVRYRFGQAEFDESSFVLTIDGASVNLQRKPLEVLAVLLRHYGRTVTKDEMLAHVWPGQITVDNVVANAVSKLRKALRSEGHRLINQSRIGYRLEGPVEKLHDGRRIYPFLAGFSKGIAVPRRPGFVMEELISETPDLEIWLACHVETREPRIFKFCLNHKGLEHLRAEARALQGLQKANGAKSQLDHPIRPDLDHEPPFVEICPVG